MIKETKNTIVFENLYVKIEISKKDATVLSITDKTSGESVMGESVSFFQLFQMIGDDDDKPFDYVKGVEVGGSKTEKGSVKQAVETTSLDYADGIITVNTVLGKVEVKVGIYDDCMTLEIMNKLPRGAYSFVFGNAKFEYDIDNPETLRATDVAMTVNTKPFFYPDGFKKEIKGEAFEHLGGVKGAKLGIVIAPETVLREALKSVCSLIDKNKGLVLKSAGPWAQDNPMSYGDYIISGETERNQLIKDVEFFKTIGVDQVDFHQGDSTFRQGDLHYYKYENHADFKKHVSDLLEANGMQAGLHTYVYYIHPDCHEFLADPKWQADLDKDEEFTLAEDVSADADFFPTVESTAGLSDYYGFFTRNLPYFLIGEEIVKYTNHPQGFKTCIRGIGGTKPVAHKKGERIHHLIGCFYLFAPAAGSELFKKIAHVTAETYNKGGFKMIYLDALDGMDRHCKPDERWYYYALFVHEICKNCEIDPIIEYSAMDPSIWAARARVGAWDYPYRSYKAFNEIHHKDLKAFARRHYACTLGWYNYYPMSDRQPGNYHTRYHHWDSIDHMGSLAVMYNYSTVFQGFSAGIRDRYEGYRRNVELYKMYSDLRKSKYFSEETLAKARANPYEKAIVKRADGKYTFVERNYQTKRLFDALDEKRNTVSFENPFKKQTPFVRIEAGMSTLGDEPMVLYPLNENCYIKDLCKKISFGGELDLTNNLAMKVRVKGNGKKGSIGIKTYCASNSEHGHGLYIIDTDFEGWREFVLCEADNGTRPELEFEKGDGAYPIYRAGLNVNRLTGIEVKVTGDVDGVFMSSIVACRHVYDVIKNPTISIGKQTLMFECELKSTDFIEFDGEKAVVVDRFANEKPIYFTGTCEVPKGKYDVKFVATSSLNKCPVNLHITMGTTGKE
ncbi:MAG: hypothetical protein IKV53_03610, partial [Clostridia bacterium]|nr:hypothetical protein [Clostridia bacterium]